MLQQTVKRRAISLLEVLVVVSIIAVLAAIGLAISGPARERGRQAACAENLRQLHQAVMMYTSGVDAAEEVPGLGPLACGARFQGYLNPYIKNRDILYCPDLPYGLRRKVGRSYTWMPISSAMISAPSAGERGMLNEQAQRIQAMGSRFPLYVCSVHDEMYYQPQESDVNDAFAQPYVIEVSVGGTIYSGRRPYMRTKQTAGWAMLP